MFNFVMGIVMIGVGVVCTVLGVVSKSGTKMAGLIFFGILMFGFGIVELVRSKKVKENKKRARDREFDMYSMIAAEMGVKINPITGEVVGKNEVTDTKTENTNL